MTQNHPRPLQTLSEVRTYLKQEQEIAQNPSAPEYQVFTSLLHIAEQCETIEAFLTQAHALPIAGPEEEVKEAKEWVRIALGTITGEEQA